MCTKFDAIEDCLNHPSDEESPFARYRQLLGSTQDEKEKLTKDFVVSDAMRCMSVIMSIVPRIGRGLEMVASTTWDL